MTTTPRLLGPADRRAMPWKNGLGTTFEIARAPATGDDFLWRMSLADVTAAGPFSSFAGYERAIVVVRGNGMRLRHDGGDWVSLSRLQVHRFSGDARTDGKLVAGPVRDFNLIWKRGAVRGDLRALVLRPGCSEQPLSGPVALVLCLRGECRVTSDAAAWTLAEDAALLWPDGAPSQVALVPAGTVAEVLVAQVSTVA